MNRQPTNTMKSAKDLLDELMGKQRDIPEAERRTIHFYDKEIDKMWLCGLQPMELFRNTPWTPKLPEIYRRAVGREYDPISIDTPQGIKEAFEATSEEEKLRYGYEMDLYKYLDELVKTNDRAVQRARLQHEKNAMEVSDVDAIKLRAIEEEITTFTKEAEKLGESGEVDASLALMKKVDECQRSKDIIIKPNDLFKMQKVLVCEICGNVVQNTEVRIEEHYSGRIYLSWKAARDKHAELVARLGPLAEAVKNREEKLKASKPAARRPPASSLPRRRSPERPANPGIRGRSRSRDRSSRKEKRSRSPKKRSRSPRRDKHRKKRNRSRSRSRSRSRRR